MSNKIKMGLKSLINGKSRKYFFLVVLNTLKIIYGIGFSQP